MNRFIFGLLLVVILAIGFFYVWRKSNQGQLKNILPKSTSPVSSVLPSSTPTNVLKISSPTPRPTLTPSPLIPAGGKLPETGV